MIQILIQDFQFLITLIIHLNMLRNTAPEHGSEKVNLQK